MSYLHTIASDPRTETAFPAHQQVKPVKQTYVNVQSVQVWKVYANDLDKARYVVAKNLIDAETIGAGLFNVPRKDITARYVITTSKPEKTIAELRKRGAK